METPAAARKIAANALEAFLDGYVIVPDGSPLAHDPIVLDMMRNRLEAVRRWLTAAAVGAGLFLLTQSANWFAMRPPDDAPSLYLATFYILTGVHALHVIGGFVPLGIVLYRATRRQYSSSSHEGLSLCAQYWHYLGAVWLVLVATLYLGNR